QWILIDFWLVAHVVQWISMHFYFFLYPFHFMIQALKRILKELFYIPGNRFFKQIQLLCKGIDRFFLKWREISVFNITLITLEKIFFTFRHCIKQLSRSF